MGEIFTMERSGETLRFTGERLTSAMSGQIEIEHLHRYFLVREMARGKDVLDIACGEGYGAALLAQVAGSVVAMDVSPEAVEHATLAYRRPNLTFHTSDARRIEAPDSAFDLVVSFETLEHFYEHEQFYVEIRRVLRPGGLFIVSTPDRDVYSPDGSTANRYHVRELTRIEFENGLGAIFPHVAMLLQRPMIGSLMLAAEPFAAEARAVTFEQRGRDMFEANTGLPRALYLIAVASDQPVRVPVASAYVETSQLAVREGEILRQLEAKDLEAERLVIQALGERENAIRERDKAIGESDRSARLLAETQTMLQAIKDSKSWQITAPIRSVMRVLRREQRPLSPPNPATPEPAAPQVVQSQIVSTAERLRQRYAMGTDLPPPTLSIAVGIVTYDTDEEVLARCISSAEKAGAHAGIGICILLIDNGRPSASRPGVRKLDTQGNIGFGRAHNVLMREAFSGGVDVYVATNPDGAFHPHALERMARVIMAEGGRVLVEACQFPAEHPKEYNPVTLETPWASGACLAIPRAVFEATGGFDDAFFMYCEDVDLSWRVRAVGMKVLIAPHALFLHAVTNRATGAAMHQLMLASAVLLGRKWGNIAFAEAAATQLVGLGVPVPGANPEPVGQSWRDIPDFTRGFSFAPARW